MNDELAALQRAMEEATAAQSPAGEALGAEARALRPGWLALGRLLQSAESAAAAPPPMVIMPAPSRRRPAVAALCAVAGSLVVGVAIGWLLGGKGPSTVSPASPETTIARNAPPAPASVGHPLAGGGPRPSPAHVEANWDRPESPGSPPIHLAPEATKLAQEDARLAGQSRALAAEYRHAQGAQRDKIKAELEQLVNRQFAVRTQLQSLRVDLLERELQGWRQAIERRAEAEKELVRKRLSQLLSGDEGGKP